MASLEFNCGTVVDNIGMPGLAIRDHMYWHQQNGSVEDLECIEDCQKELKNYKDSYTEVN